MRAELGNVVDRAAAIISLGELDVGKHEDVAEQGPAPTADLDFRRVTIERAGGPCSNLATANHCRRHFQHDRRDVALAKNVLVTFELGRRELIMSVKSALELDNSDTVPGEQVRRQSDPGFDVFGAMNSFTRRALGDALTCEAAERFGADRPTNLVSLQVDMVVGRAVEGFAEPKSEGHVLHVVAIEVETKRIKTFVAKR